MSETIDPAIRKRVLREFTYGLYAVSAIHDGERGIFTANWLSQVSFDPLLVAVSIERESSTLPLIEASGRFAVATFRSDQRDLAAALGKPKVRAGDKFAALDLEIVETASGIPVPGNLLGYVECALVSVTGAGDSVVVIGAVTEVRSLAEEDAAPLTMREAGFRHAG
ncbi:MAG TPA: flavin reductase family protein [Thermomicrobiales bacterium]|nr:flavin reductase family protein [Thermomicrobiales bacterium]